MLEPTLSDLLALVEGLTSRPDALEATSQPEDPTVPEQHTGTLSLRELPWPVLVGDACRALPEDADGDDVLVAIETMFRAASTGVHERLSPLLNEISWAIESYQMPDAVVALPWADLLRRWGTLIAQYDAEDGRETEVTFAEVLYALHLACLLTNFYAHANSIRSDYDPRGMAGREGLGVVLEQIRGFVYHWARWEGCAIPPHVPREDSGPIDWSSLPYSTGGSHEHHR